MSLLDLFGTAGKLRRGEQALQEKRWPKAQARFSAAWMSLQKRRRKGSPDLASENRALSGLAQATSGNGHIKEALEHCRTGRRLGLDEKIFYEFPPSHAVSSGSSTKETIEDLVAWACWPGAANSWVPRAEVESRLRTLLKPRSRAFPAASERALGRLESSPLGWSWPPLYRAELARHRGQWRQAATYLERAIARVPSTPIRARLLWSQAHCLDAAGERRKAYRQMRSAYELQRPGSPVQWLLAARLSVTSGEPQFAFEAIRAGLDADSDNAELLLDPERLCQGPGDWQVVRLILGKLVAAAEDERALTATLRLQCAVAMKLEDTDLALASARRILEHPRWTSGPHEGLRAFAAAVLSFAGALTAKSAAVLLRGVRSKAVRRRIHVAELSAALAAEDAERIWTAWQAVQKRPLAPRTEAEWKGLLLSLAPGLLAYQARYSGLLEGCGLLELARENAHRRLLDSGGTPAELHSLALINLSLLGRQRGSQPQATERLCETLGAWASLLHHSEAVQCFATARYRRYGKTGSAPNEDRILQSAAAQVLALLESDDTGGQIGAGRLKLMWELECRAVAAVAQLGGLATGRSDRPVHAGPFLARALGLRQVVSDLIERPLRNLPAGTDLLRRLLAAVSEDPLPAVEEKARSGEIRRLFSPLGFAAIHLRHRQLDRLREELDRVRSHIEGKLPQGDRLLDILSGHLGKGKKSWLRRASRELLVESHLEASRELVARVPVPFDLVRESWHSALKEAARLRGGKDPVRTTISEIAVGRGKALFRRRNRTQRQADATDKRPNRLRREEAFGLMTLAWDLTADSGVQGPLTEHLNLHAVEQANREDLDAAIESLLRALKINPGARRAAENLAAVLMNRLHRGFEEDSDDAGRRLLEAMEKIRALDLSGSQPEIRKCLDKIADQGSTPFFNHSLEASEKEDRPSATDLMIWCLRIAPRDRHVVHGSYKLRHDLQEQARLGNTESQRCLARLKKYLPAVPPQVVPQAMLLRQLMEAATAIPDNAETLNQRAVAAAQAGRFDEAMNLLARAKRLAPRAEVVKINIQNISQAWLRRALETRDREELMKVHRRMRELAEND